MRKYVAGTEIELSPEQIVVIPGWNPPDRELELELEGES